jgi:ubiquinone/menaquinone biosynthesis C-methylase UbiE
MDIDRSAVFGEGVDRVERIAPGFFPAQFEREHTRRYQWASRWAQGKAILDIACGTGYGSEILSKHKAGLIFSLDISEAALAFGRNRFGILAVRSDAHDLPLSDECVDIVVSLETIEHLNEPGLFLKEIHRVLRPNGTLLLSTPNRCFTQGNNPYHVHEFTLEELQRLLADSAFAINEIWGQHWRMRSIFARVWGLRRLAWELEKLPGVIRSPIPADSAVLCAVATRA